MAQLKEEEMIERASKQFMENHLFTLEDALDWRKILRKAIEYGFGEGLFYASKLMHKEDSK